MATSRQIREYAKYHNISRADAETELNASAMAAKVVPQIIQHTLPRISYEEFAKAVPVLLQKAKDAGEMDMPLVDTTIFNPRTTNINKLQTMMMKVGANKSSERAKALWLYMSSMQKICMQNHSAEEQQEAEQALANIHQSVVKSVVEA